MSLQRVPLPAALLRLRPTVAPTHVRLLACVGRAPRTAHFETPSVPPKGGGSDARTRPVSSGGAGTAARPGGFVAQQSAPAEASAPGHGTRGLFAGTSRG